MDRSKLLPHKREEMRRKEEEEAVKQVYEEFKESFDDEKPTNKTFVRGGVVNAEDKNANSQKSKLYKPTPLINRLSTSGSATSHSGDFERARRMAEEKARKIMDEVNKQHNRPAKPGATPAIRGSRTSNLEAFKEELRALQEARSERRQVRLQLQEQLGVDSEAIDRIAPSLDNPYLGGAYDNDPFTTNLFLSNLSPEITLEDLYDQFGSFGPLASAKIMWPRSDEERARGYLCGFIAFMTRKDTDRGVASLKGKMVRGFEMKMSWAKPVPIPNQPVYVPPTMLELMMPDPPSGLPFNAQPRKSQKDAFISRWNAFPAPGQLPPSNPEAREEWQQMIRNATVRVVIPTERPLLALIHRTIEFIICEGPVFEAMLMSREMGNPTFRFLFDNQHPAHVYYRWKLFSILQGDLPNKWSLSEFRMFENGSIWRPPPMDFFRQGMPEQLYENAISAAIEHIRHDHKQEKKRDRRSRSKSPSQHSDGGSDHRRSPSPSPRSPSPRPKQPGRGTLSDKQRDQLEDLLRALIPERRVLEDAMVWCVEHANCAQEIAECVYESLTIDETPLHKKIARLYLIADILANCGAARVRDVFYYRQFVGERLEDIFKQMHKAYRRIEARLKAEQFKQRVIACFRTWEENALYPTDVLIRLQNIFLGLVKMEDDGADPEEQIADDDIDGEPLDSSAPVSKLVAYDIDGAPMDEDDAPSEEDRKPKGAFKASKWNEVDPEVVEQQAMTTSKWDMLEPHDDDDDRASDTTASKRVVDYDDDLDGVPIDDDSAKPAAVSGLATTSDAKKQTPVAKQEMSEQRRQLLRDIEVKVVKFQDDLESGRSQPKRNQTVAQEVANYRARLLEDMDKPTTDQSASKERNGKEKHSKDKKRKDDKEKKRKRSKSRSPARKPSKRSRSRSRSPSRSRRHRK